MRALCVLFNISLLQYPSEKEIYEFDPDTAVFTEHIPNKLVLITQDQGIIHVQVTLEGPNIETWRSIKDSHGCTRGGVNFHNIEQNFETELTNLLKNAGISRSIRNLENSFSDAQRTRTSPMIHVSSHTNSATSTRENVQATLQESWTVEPTEISTVTLSITPPVARILPDPTINPTFKTISTAPVITNTTKVLINTTEIITKRTPIARTESVTRKQMVSTKFYNLTSTSSPTSTTTEFIQTTKANKNSQISSKTTLSTALAKTNTTSSKTTTTIPFMNITNETWENYFTHLKQIQLKSSWMELKESLKNKYNSSREFFHLMTVYTEKANNGQKQALKPVQIIRYSDNNTNYFEITRISGERSFFFQGQRILLNSTLDLQFNFSEKTQNSKQIKKILSKIYLKITCPKQFKVALNTVRKSIKVRSYNETQSKILQENSGYLTYNFSNFDPLDRIGAYEANLIISLEINVYKDNDQYNNFEILVPLGGELLMYIGSLNHIETQFTYLNSSRTKRDNDKLENLKRFKRQIEAAIGTILGIAGDETFQGLKNLFIKSPKVDEASIISLKDHLSNFENNNINVLRNINKDIIQIHNMTQLENDKINKLICEDTVEAGEIAALAIKTSIQEALTEISLLVNNISNNNLPKGHLIIQKLLQICKKINKTQNAAEKPCTEVLTKDQHIQIINVKYNNKTNTFEIKIAAEMPLFEVIEKANITTYYFLKSIHETNSEESKIIQIDSKSFSKISAINIKPLYYSAVKYDKDAATVRVNSHGDEFMNEGVLGCINQRDDSLCPVITTRSDSSCIMQKLTTIANKKFIHFSSTEFIKLTKINSNIHGVMSDESLEGNKFNKIISRYQPHPMQIKCGLKQINLGVDPFQDKIKITLKTITNPLPIRDPIEKLSTQIVEKDKSTKSDLSTLNQELQSLNEDSALKLGGQNIIEPGHWKYITIVLTMLVSLFITYKIMKYLFHKIKNYWLANFNNQPRQNQRLNGHRLSTRNLNRNSHHIATNNV